MGVYIKGMDMPKPKLADTVYDAYVIVSPNGHATIVVDNEDGLDSTEYQLIEVPTPHGRCIDADALETDLKRQCKEVFRTDAVSPDDYWITRNQAYNENLWKTWCESFYDYLKTRPIIIPTEESE